MHNLHILPYYRITQTNDSLIYKLMHTQTDTYKSIYIFEEYRCTSY